MRAKFLALPFALVALLLAGQTSRAQQAFIVPAAPKATPQLAPAQTTAAVAPTPQASATPKKKKTQPLPPSLGFYSGKIRIVNVDNVGCVGIDQKTGATIVCTPRFKGNWMNQCRPNFLITFQGNKILAVKNGVTIIAPTPGLEDRTPYTGPALPPPSVGAGAAIGVAGAVLGILGSVHR